jgi:hypothetical protein
MKWDEERATEIINEIFDEVLHTQKLKRVTEFDSYKKLVEFLGSVRAEAIGWAWTEACSAYSKGLDPNRAEIPAILEKAQADLNPERK